MSSIYDDPDHASIKGCVARSGSILGDLGDINKIPWVPKEPEGLAATLRERGSRYGDFTNNARVAQQIREIIRAAESWNRMTPVEQEALEAIVLKISRIVTGDPHYPDNWHDIQGFAKLAEDRLPETPVTPVAIP